VNTVTKRLIKITGQMSAMS